MLNVCAVESFKAALETVVYRWPVWVAEVVEKKAGIWGDEHATRVKSNMRSRGQVVVVRLSRVDLAWE